MISDTANPEPKWRRLPEERPRQIIDAALEVFSEHGLAAARLEDIARLAGVSKGTIYLYFPNKEALFCEMIREMVGESLAQTQLRITSNTASATTLLTEYLQTLWENVRSPVFEKLYRLVMGDLQSFPALLDFFTREVSLRAMELMAEIVRRGIANGEFRAVDPDAAARIVHAAAVKHGIWYRQRERIPFLAHLSDQEVFEQLLDFTLHAIQSTPNAPVGGSHA